MKVLVIEDNEEKYSSIRTLLEDGFDKSSLEVTLASHLGDATSEIYQHKFDLLVIDLMVPARSGTEPIDISDEILDAISKSEKNSSTRAIAITGFIELLEGKLQAFNEAGITVVQYQANVEAWKKSLSRELERASNVSLFDFVIICALEKERNAFEYTDAKIGDTRYIRGLNCLDIQLGEQRGVIVQPPRMGMTDAAIISTRAIDEFRPKVIAMSGICAGIPGKAAIGDVIIAENCFDYQVGKWDKDGQKFEMYQISIPENVRGLVSNVIAANSKGSEYRKGLLNSELNDRSFKLVTHASGSAVVADETKRNEIVAKHRKLASVEMEIYSMYRAACLSPYSPMFFAVKGVVDDAGDTKGDQYHQYGSVVSARFLVKCLNELFSSQ